MLESLEYLSLQYQGLVAVPPEIGQLKNLHTVNVSHNPNLLSVSAQIASLPLKRKSHNICNVIVSPPLTSCLCVLRPPPYLLDNTHNICALINSHTPCSDCHLISQTRDMGHKTSSPSMLAIIPSLPPRLCFRSGHHWPQMPANKQWMYSSSLALEQCVVGTQIVSPHLEPESHEM